MSSKPKRRWRLFADWRLQGEFLIRLTVYWAILMVAVVGTIAIFNFITNGEAKPTALIVPLVIVTGLILPMIMFDAIAFSNRFAGPIIRLTRELREIADGKTEGQVVFRSKDFYKDLETAFNDVRLKSQFGELISVTPPEVDAESVSALIGAGHE